ncbi:MAG: CU044_2847 family protein [Ardenticatenaceae bacterium]
MASYLEFATESGERFLVEVDGPLPEELLAGDDGAGNEPEFDLDDGEVQVSAGAAARRAMGVARNTFDDALSIVKSNATAFIGQIKQLPDPPDEVEISFGLKGTCELGGSFVVAKAGAEASYTVTLTWNK